MLKEKLKLFHNVNVMLQMKKLSHENKEKLHDLPKSRESD